MNTSATRLMLTALLAGTLVAANAADRDRQPPDFDADGDGCISQTEFETTIETMRDAMENQGGGRGRHGQPPTFAELDTSDDGCISEDELRAMRDKRRGDRGPRERP